MGQQVSAGNWQVIEIRADLNLAPAVNRDFSFTRVGKAIAFCRFSLDWQRQPDNSASLNANLFMVKHSVFTALVLVLNLASGVVSAQDTSIVSASTVVKDNHRVCPPNLQRPCVALVLGGGGARGSAHIGVLRALQEQRIPVDLVVGTSIGSFVGGLYASGKSVDDIEGLFYGADWNAGYQDDLSRSRIPVRRKRQLDNYPIQLDLGFDSEGVKLPQGFLQGQGMKALVDRMLGTYRHFDSFDQLPVPFRAVAADVETGEEVILDGGDLATALQISMSIPGVVRPIEINGRLLVDGGVANNLPVSVAQALGADIVIAVDIGSPPLKKDQLTSGVSILRQMTAFLVQKNVSYQKSLLRADDLYIQPAIDGVGTLSFDRATEAIAAGYRDAVAGINASPALQGLRGSDQSVAVQALSPDQAFTFDHIDLINNSRLGDDYILHRMRLSEGNAYSQKDIQKGIDRLYGQGTIARINSSVHTDEEQSTLGIYVGEKEWGPGYLDFKLSVEDDFSSFSRYQIGGSYRLTNLSPYGAEWFSAAEFGTDKLLLTEFYWPLYNSGFYLFSAAEVERNVQQVSESGVALGETIITQGSVYPGLGWNSVDVLDVRLVAVYREGELDLPDLLAEVTGVDTLDFVQTGALLEINYDSLDNATFPTHGVKFQSRLLRSRDELETLEEYSTLIDNEINVVGSLGRHSLRGLLRYQSAVNDDPLSLLGAFELGGFLNLSGNKPGEFSGQHVRFGSLVYTYELVANDFGAITLPLYLGLSAETGNTWDDKRDIDYSDLIFSTSLFIGWDSPIGPAYFAYGDSDTGERSLYLFLGVVF